MKVTKIHQFEGHEGAIYSLQYNALTNKIYSAGFDNIIVEWDLNDPKKYKAIAKLPTKTISLLFIEELNWLISGQSDGGVHIIDLTEHEEIHFLKVHNDMIFSLLYIADTSELYIGSGDGRISVWQTKGMEMLSQVNLNSKKIRDIKLFNGLIYVGCGDGSTKILSQTALREIDVINTHLEDFSVNCIWFNELNHMVTGSRDGHLNVHDVNNSHQLIHRIPAHNYAIYSLAFSEDNKLFASASRDKSVKIWNSHTLDFVHKVDFTNYRGHTASVNAVLWIGDKLITTGDDRKIIVWMIER